MTQALDKKGLCSAISLGLWLCCLALCFAGFFGRTVQAAPRPAQTATGIAAQTVSPFALADFDGDRQLDLATVQVGQPSASQTRYWIHFRLSSGVRQFIPLMGPAGGLRIASRDVNGDSFLDLVVTTAWQELPVAVLLNDGRGNFTIGDPHAFPAAMARAPGSSASAIRSPGEIAAALPGRNSSSRSVAVQRSAPPRACSGSIFDFAFQEKSAGSFDSVLARAPPVLHV